MRRRTLALTSALLFSVSCGGSARGPDLEIVFFEVGHGDAVLIREGADAIEIDAGLPNTGVVAKLRHLGVDSLRAFIASHNHGDHIGSAATVFDSLAVAEFVDNGFRLETPAERGVLDAAERHRIAATSLIARRTWTLGDATVEALPPPATSDTAQNNHSLVVLVTRGSFRALLTGDSERAETDLLSSQLAEPVALFKAPHHGDPRAVSPEWLRVLHPRVIVASASREGVHPLDLEAVYWTPGVCLVRTSELGDVTITVDTKGRPALRGSRGRAPRSCPS